MAPPPGAKGPLARSGEGYDGDGETTHVRDSGVHHEPSLAERRCARRRFRCKNALAGGFGALPYPTGRSQDTDDDAPTPNVRRSLVEESPEFASFVHALDRVERGARNEYESPRISRRGHSGSLQRSLLDMSEEFACGGVGRIRKS